MPTERKAVLPTYSAKASRRGSSPKRLPPRFEPRLAFLLRGAASQAHDFQTDRRRGPERL